MDLGVRCSSHQEVCVSMYNEPETTVTMSVPTQEPSSTQSGSISSKDPISTENTQAVNSNCIFTTMPEGDLKIVLTESNCTSMNQFSGESMSVNKTLGVLTGLLAAALVAVTMGWIVSCVYWQRRNKRR